MNIIIGSDIVPTSINLTEFSEKRVDELMGEELWRIWQQADHKIFNLETPITDSENKLDKQGPAFKAPPETMRGIQQLNPSLVALANNHILDYKKEGLLDTVKLLQSYNLNYVGVGENKTEAANSYVIQDDSLKVGIYNCTESEFSVVGKNYPGANPFDPLESLDHINTLKEESDYIIVLYHGGKEYYRYPTPELQKRCRKMVEKGADVVICQHSHCIGSYEEYDGGTIVYGQGNFLFNKYDNEYWNTGLLVNLELSEERIETDFLPIKIKDKGIEAADSQEKDYILQQFYQRSKEISDENNVLAKYEEFVEEKSEEYKRKILGFGRYLTFLDKHLFKGNISNFLLTRRKAIKYLNYIEAEPHREILIHLLKKYSNK